MTYGADEVQKKLRQELEHYLITQYLAKTSVLVEALKGRLDDEGILYQAPYIEAAPAYETVPDGIAHADLPAWLKTLFAALQEKHLGVYPAPFRHQIQALEAATKGRDLFVATGTGSGKTECFLWPLLAKLAGEARERPTTWRMRGVRALVMYPMNALVSDQVSRLRRLIGDPAHGFLDAFHAVADGARRPQFGMYTGRTPYPGPKPDKQQDHALARTLASFLPQEGSEGFYEKLLADGRIPAKENLGAFLARVNDGDHTPSPDDAELITRFEMQQVTPDILITNYSMLEYMLLRPVETHLWEETRAWLQASAENRLLFIIDEAHMYRGSSGGEVALLLRRLLHRLGIGRDRVQFILTTASMPASSPEDDAAVRAFAVALTGAKDFSQFTYLTGVREDLSQGCTQEIPQAAFDAAAAHLAAFTGTEEEKLAALRAFFTAAAPEAAKTFASLTAAQPWLYAHLLDFAPFHALVTLCRGQARSLQELAEKIFPQAFAEDRERAIGYVSVLLAITPFARSSSGAVLFPARMHMLFRGLHGIYACTNPDCPHGTHAGGLHLGEVFLEDDHLVCPDCDSTVYELHYDRRCGALFYHGYVMQKAIDGAVDAALLWRYPGELMDEELQEIELYLPPDGYRAKPDRENPILPCYLDTKSGFLHFGDDAWAERPGVRKLYYGVWHKKGEPDAYTFASCPHCGHPFGRRQLASFSTRGNESFYNLIRAQFQFQPPVPGKEDVTQYPNQGRKCLLFSDSRQRAARLARDMSNASDRAAARPLFALAVRHMDEAGEHSLDDLYGFFCLAAAERNVVLYHGADREIFAHGMKQAARRAKRGRPPGLTMKDAPASFKVTVLQLFAGAYNTVYDTALGWLEPTDEALEELEDEGIDIEADGGKEDVCAFLHAWWMSIFGRNAALASDIGDEIREEFRFRGSDPFGLKAAWTFSRELQKIMGWTKRSDEMEMYHDALDKVFLSQGANGQRYVNTSCVRPAFDPQATWYRCDQCSEITPLMLRGCCPNCGSHAIHAMTPEEMATLDFWRAPVLATLAGGPVRLIDTEEHTAQLSHKDQRNDAWSQTESYELRFQDLVQKDEQPVDILSSTTTMEVGIDIGSLVAVGLRNIPPMRENYQQRAGRAGRRGSSLSTIVTFCEDGPHDSLYFKKPEPMLRGDPRRPWIDDQSPKLLHRHVTLVSLVRFLEGVGESIDQMGAWDFFHSDKSAAYLARTEAFAAAPQGSLLPTSAAMDWDAWRNDLGEKFQRLAETIDRHPERYGVDDDGIGDHPKSLLDALYEEGIIPTYSFPKNVVSLYTFADQRVKYTVERGLDIAISEDAPGRSVVVDKETYQIGGLYTPHSEYRKGFFQQPARAYMEDGNYHKALYACAHCNWFGFEEPEGDICPFCGEASVERTRDMVRPWGFAPRDAQPIAQAQLQEAYSSAQTPVYSTLPDASLMEPVAGWSHVRMARRTDQHIIMVNEGPDGKGFLVCNDCGAAVPGDDEKALHDVRRPYPGAKTRCMHRNHTNVNLGYDFVTDMLVLEIPLDDPALDAGRDHPMTWLQRAAQSLAEALRMTVSKELDIEYTELVSGYRIRQQGKGACVDIYLYDSLSSGAGYALRLADDLPGLLTSAQSLLAGCTCDSACYNCLKHYRNQYVHAMLDRHAALVLLAWAETGRIAPPLSLAKQKAKLAPLQNILAAAGCTITCDDASGSLRIERVGRAIRLLIYPWMNRTPQKMAGILALPDALFKYAKPYALESILNALR